MPAKVTLQAKIVSLFVLLALVVGGYVALRGIGPFRGSSPGPQLHLAGADAARGKAMIREYGCSSCHTVPSVRGAKGRVGPRLDWVSEQTYIAGILRNTPQNLVYWIRNPQEASPRTAMPDLDVAEQDARDIAAYLYSLR